MQRAKEGDTQHIDRLPFAATSVSFVMDIVILIECCRPTHLYSVCDKRLSVTVYVLYVVCVCVSCYATTTCVSLHVQIATKTKNVPAQEG